LCAVHGDVGSVSERSDVRGGARSGTATHAGGV